MITKYKLFEEKSEEKLKGKFKKVDYKAFNKDWRGKPLEIITDYKIHGMYDTYVEIISKGYKYRTLSENDFETSFKEKSKKGWIAFDDYSTNKVRKLNKNKFTDGQKRIKVFELKPTT